MDIVRRYLAAVASQDWVAAGTSLAEDVERIGPFGDSYRGRGPYLAYLAQLMPTLMGYSMQVRRTSTAGSMVTAELSETLTLDGKEIVTEECLVFDLDADGVIGKISIYIQTG